MSLAINREEINEFAFNGLASPQQFTGAAGAEFYDPAWARAYADYDPDRARQLLDVVGLHDTDGDGIREDPNGNSFAIAMNTSSSSVIGRGSIPVSWCGTIGTRLACESTSSWFPKNSIASLPTQTNWT